MKADLSELVHRFSRRWIDDIPEKLEAVQESLGELRAAEMVVNIISLAYKHLRPGTEKS